ncbi:MAG: YqeG family HAD IIIA-type phosphatase [Tenericutes bacterium]|jgi:HAD superfamily phosphatase (TIGR01668 family)|nr:YqeG family HAD IIIA-type phosphatase [Mycoplasmatota bacterium]
MIEIFLRKKYFYPKEYHQTIYDIDFIALKEKGIKNILIDLDNTLIPYDEHLANDQIKTLMKKLESLDFKVMIISNNNEQRVKKFCDDIDCEYIFSARKPFKYGFKKALKKLNHPPRQEVALIGDQFMTDVFGGNRMGFYTIVVDAIKRKTEKWYTKLNRRLERKVLHRLKRTDLEYYEKLHLEGKR